jgi:hypothetical protein
LAIAVASLVWTPRGVEDDGVDVCGFESSDALMLLVLALSFIV